MKNYFTNDFSKEIWETKYKHHTDNTVEDTWRRVAKDLASVEKDKEYWEDQFYSILEGFKFTPGGRITANAGTGRKGLSYINCVTDSFEGYDQDSIEGIYSTLMRQAKILQSESGYGFNCDVMRPRGATIKGIGNQSPGAVKFLELWDKSSEIITAGSGKKSRNDEKVSIRKGAQLVSMSVWHPDIIEFITAKTEHGRLTKFNMSVLCNDEFMKAVEEDKEWNLRFPDYEFAPDTYKKCWDGNLKKWENAGAGIKVYQTIPAKELWEMIMQQTYKRNDPGILQYDTINRMNNLWFVENINSTNPCGEQPLDRSVCLLGNLNLIHYIDTEKKDWKYKELKNDIEVAVRLMDNVNDVSSMSLKIHQDSLKEKRRIGLGVVGYASALMMCRIKYGSKKALELTETLMEFKTNAEYQASTKLAQEKGSFLLFDKEKYLQSKFIKQLSSDTKALIKKHGIRNSHLSSIQPCGHTSVLANNISSGLEAIFAKGYFRTIIIHQLPDNMSELIVNWKKREFTTKSKDNINWKWTKEGDEDILITEFNEITYKFDRNRGLTKEEWVEDYAIHYLKEKKLWNDNVKWASTAQDLNVKDHIETMKIFAKWVDAGCSKTLNFPHDYPYEDFKNVYFDAWKSGIKGFTTYRAGTMTNVLSTESSNKPNKRPQILSADIHHHVVQSRPYLILVGINNDKPYEVFVLPVNGIDKKIDKGQIVKVRKNRYKAIIGEDEICPLYGHNETEDLINRLVSTALQTNVDLSTLINRLNKTTGNMTSLSKVLIRVLRKYIPDNTSSEDLCPECQNTLIFQESCLKCIHCGFSKCS